MSGTPGHSVIFKLWLYFFLGCYAYAQKPGSQAALLYKQNCSACHATPQNPRIPKFSTLRQMSPEAVLHSLESGAMKAQAESLTAPQKRAVAVHVTGKNFKANREATGKCSSVQADVLTDTRGWNGWGVNLANTRFQPADSAALTEADIPKLKLRWAFAFPRQSQVMAQPAVTGNRIYIGSADGTIYSLNADTGCIHWSAHAESSIRAAASVVPEAHVVIFADLAANVYAFDANAGKQLWKTKVEDFPGARVSGSPQVYESTIYVPVSSVEENTSYDTNYQCCRFRGSIVALDLKTGQQIWKTYTTSEPAKTRINAKGTQLWGPSGAGIWSTPTLDPQHNLLYVATGNNYSEPATGTSDAILALDMKTGKIVWMRQTTAKDIYNGSCDAHGKLNCPDPGGPDSDFGGPPMLISLPSGKSMLVASQKSAIVTALDPDNNGEVLWQTRVGEGGPLGGIEWGSSVDFDHIYVPLSDTKLIPRKDDDPDLHPAKGGGIFALDLLTGKVEWQTAAPSECAGVHNCGPANSAPTTVIPGVVFAGAVDGRIRAYSAKDGRILWNYNTAHAYRAVNGVSNARGGSIDSAGPVVANGKLFVVSGYSLWGGRPGNVLLEFTVDGR